MILGASRPFVPIEVGYFELRRDDDVRYQALVGHVCERIITEPFNNPQSFFNEIEVACWVLVPRQETGSRSRRLPEQALDDLYGPRQDVEEAPPLG